MFARCVSILALTALVWTAGCSNHKPALVPIGNKTIETGRTLQITVRAVDDDGDELQFGIEGKPQAAEFTQVDKSSAEFIWTPLASDAGPDGRGQDFPVTFKVTDGINSDSETILITVTLGGAGTGAPVFITPADYTLDLDRKTEIKFNIEVRDPDSPAVDMRLEDGIPGATFDSTPGSKLAAFRWTPTQSQIAEKPVWNIRVSADDHVNARVFQDIAILIKGGASTKCEGSPPQLTHDELPDQRGSGDYPIQITATDADTSIQSVALYYLVDLGDGTGTYQKAPMTQAGGSNWQGAIPNPNLQGDATAKVSYYLQARDNDDPEGDTCDQTALLPEDGRFSFTAYAVGNDQCANDGFEANQTVSAAVEVQDGTYNGLKICAGDEDWFLVQVPANNLFGAGILFTQANGQLQMDVYDASGTTILAGGQTEQNQVVAYLDASGQARTVAIRVRGSVGVENSYDMVVVIDEYVPCNDDNYEPNDTPNDAPTLTEGDYPNLACCNNPDWYKIDLQAGDGLDILVEFTTADGDLDLWVFDPSAFDDEVLNCDNAVACSTTETDDEEISVAAMPATGTYYIAIGPYQGAQNSYGMLVLVTPGQQTCQDDGDEENDQPADAVGIWDSGPRSAMMCSGDEDWYKTYMYATETLILDLLFTHADGDLDLRLYSDGVTMDTLAAHRLASSDSSTDNERIEFPITTEGEYYIRIFGYQGAENDYSLEMTIQ